MESYRKVKIVATLGPATTTLGKIRACVDSGVNVFRLNMSHGAHDVHAQSVRRSGSARWKKIAVTLWGFWWTYKDPSYGWGPLLIQKAFFFTRRPGLYFGFGSCARRCCPCFFSPCACCLGP